MPDFSLAGKNAVVTAATRGSMGHGIAIALAQQGANVAVCELPGQAEGLAETVAELRALGVKAWSTHADMTVRDEVEALFDGAVAQLGSVDIAVATVGVSHLPCPHHHPCPTLSPQQPRHSQGNPPPDDPDAVVDPHAERKADSSSILGMSFDDYLKTTTTTQFSSWHTAQCAAQRMAAQGTGGRIILIGSVMADMAAPGASTYSASKAAIKQLGRSMANELGSQGIRVS